MLTIKYHTMFKKDFKRIKKRGYDISRLEKIVELLEKKSAKTRRILLKKALLSEIKLYSKNFE